MVPNDCLAIFVLEFWKRKVPEELGSRLSVLTYFPQGEMNSSVHTIQRFEVSLVSLPENPKAVYMLCWISD